tara:strand:- start:9614 stop:11149 length:1536 start_codon:yes stop_codon:yes gene_type:complete
MSRNPFTNVTLGEGASFSPVEDRSLLYIGQKTASGSAVSGSYNEITSKSEISALFGIDSHISKILRGVFNTLSISTIIPKISIIPLDDAGAGVAASGSIAITGPALLDGSLDFYIDSELNKYSLPIIKDETATQIGDKLVALVALDLEANFSLVNVSGTIAVTSKNKGTVGNSIGISYKGAVSGVGVAITAMSSGATDPVLTALLDVIDGTRKTSIVMPSSYDLTLVEAELETRFNFSNNVLDGVLFVGKEDSYTNIKALADSKDDKNLVIIGNKIISSAFKKGGAVLENIDVLTAKIATLSELLLTKDSNISSIVSNSAKKGASYFAGIPLFNTIIAGYSAIKVDEKFTLDQISELKKSQVTLINNNKNSNLLLLNTVFTTYRTNSKGEADLTYKFLNRRLTLSLIREFIDSSIIKDFPQHTLIPRGANITNIYQVGEDQYITKMVSYYDSLSQLPYSLLVSSDEARVAFKEIIEKSLLIDTAQGKISSEVSSYIVSQLREIDIFINPKI